MINGVSSASTDYNSIELSIIPNERQKTNFKIEVTDYASILHMSNAISLIDGRLSYTIPFDYWKGKGTIKVRLLSDEGNSAHMTLTNKSNLNGSEQVIVKYGESNYEISVVEKTSVSSLIDLFLPVGHIITNASPLFDPNKVYVGTKWGRIQGRVIVGVQESVPQFASTKLLGGSLTNTHQHFQTVSFDSQAVYVTTTPTRSRVILTKRGAFTCAQEEANARQDSTYEEEIDIVQPYYTSYIWERIS